MAGRIKALPKISAILAVMTAIFIVSSSCKTARKSQGQLPPAPEQEIYSQRQYFTEYENTVLIQAGFKLDDPSDVYIYQVCTDRDRDNLDSVNCVSEATRRGQVVLQKPEGQGAARVNILTCKADGDTSSKCIDRSQSDRQLSLTAQPHGEIPEKLHSDALMLSRAQMLALSSSILTDGIGDAAAVEKYCPHLEREHSDTYDYISKLRTISVVDIGDFVDTIYLGHMDYDLANAGMESMSSFQLTDPTSQPTSTNRFRVTVYNFYQGLRNEDIIKDGSIDWRALSSKVIGPIGHSAIQVEDENGKQVFFNSWPQKDTLQADLNVFANRQQVTFYADGKSIDKLLEWYDRSPFRYDKTISTASSMVADRNNIGRELRALLPEGSRANFAESLKQRFAEVSELVVHKGQIKNFPLFGVKEFDGLTDDNAEFAKNLAKYDTVAFRIASLELQGLADTERLAAVGEQRTKIMDEVVNKLQVKSSLSIFTNLRKYSETIQSGDPRMATIIDELSALGDSRQTYDRLMPVYDGLSQRLQASGSMIDNNNLRTRTIDEIRDEITNNFEKLKRQYKGAMPENFISLYAKGDRLADSPIYRQMTADPNFTQYAKAHQVFLEYQLSYLLEDRTPIAFVSRYSSSFSKPDVFFRTSPSIVALKSSISQLTKLNAEVDLLRKNMNYGSVFDRYGKDGFSCSDVTTACLTKVFDDEKFYRRGLVPRDPNTLLKKVSDVTGAKVMESLGSGLAVKRLRLAGGNESTECMAALAKLQQNRRRLIDTMRLGLVHLQAIDYLVGGAK